MSCESESVQCLWEWFDFYCCLHFVRKFFTFVLVILTCQRLSICILAVRKINWNHVFRLQSCAFGKKRDYNLAFSKGHFRSHFCRNLYHSNIDLFLFCAFFFSELRWFIGMTFFVDPTAMIFSVSSLCGITFAIFVLHIIKKSKKQFVNRS